MRKVIRVKVNYDGFIQIYSAHAFEATPDGLEILLTDGVILVLPHDKVFHFRADGFFDFNPSLGEDAPADGDPVALMA